MPGVLLCCSAHQAHREPPTPVRVLLCRSVHQISKGPLWVGFYTVVPCVKCLMGQPLYWASVDAGLWGERGSSDGPTPYCLASVLLSYPTTISSLTSPRSIFSQSTAALAAQLSHCNLLPHIPSLHLFTVNSSPHPGIALQSLNSSSQLLYLPGEQHSCPRYVGLWQGMSDSHPI